MFLIRSTKFEIRNKHEFLNSNDQSDNYRLTYLAGNGDVKNGAMANGTMANCTDIRIFAKIYLYVSQCERLYNTDQPSLEDNDFRLLREAKKLAMTKYQQT